MVLKADWTGLYVEEAGFVQSIRVLSSLVGSVICAVRALVFLGHQQCHTRCPS